MDKKTTTDAESSPITLDELLKRQSVRATFKLSQDVINLLGVIAGQLGIKQKSLLDQLAEDRLVLNRLARQAHQQPVKEKKRRQKTFVISRSTLNSINTISKNQNIPRDTLVEVSIKRLLPLVESELEKHQKRKTILKAMLDYLEAGETLQQKTCNLLGDDDVLSVMMEKQIDLLRRNIEEVDALIEKGMVMEDW